MSDEQPQTTTATCPACGRELRLERLVELTRGQIDNWPNLPPSYRYHPRIRWRGGDPDHGIRTVEIVGRDPVPMVERCDVIFKTYGGHTE